MVSCNFVSDKIWFWSEPVGMKSPKVTGELKGGWLEKEAAIDIALMCAAQGHPVPIFR